MEIVSNIMTSLISDIAPPQSRMMMPMIKKRSKKGQPDRRIIRRFVKDGREHYLHATKGWRTRRV
jgi:hypothetical protein